MPDVLCHQVDKVSFQIQANVPLGRAESPIILIKLLAFVKRRFSAPLTNKRVTIPSMVFIQGTALMEYQRRNGWFGLIWFDFFCRDSCESVCLAAGGGRGEEMPTEKSSHVKTCLLAPVEGSCDEKLTRYFYDVEAKTCKLFTYRYAY